MNANAHSSSDSLNRARRYHEAIRAALLKEWDPIGVGEIPEAHDEYDSYVPAVYKLLVTRRPQHEVFDYLWRLETEHMGLTGDRQATERFAERLLRIPREIEDYLRQATRSPVLLTSTPP